MKILKALLITSLIYPVTLLAESAPTLICPNPVECSTSSVTSCMIGGFTAESPNKSVDVGTYTFKAAFDLGGGQVICSYVNESGPTGTNLELFPNERIWTADNQDPNSAWRHNVCTESVGSCQFIQK